MFTLGMSKYADELVKLGFSDRLCCTAGDCEKFLKHCKDNDMVWFDNSYGTIVHKDFHKYFKKADRGSDKGYLIWQDLSLENKEYMFRLLDHSNFIQTVDNKDEYMITSSPYMILDANILKELMTYPYNVYIIHPNFLTYYQFILKSPMYTGHPLYELNYMFTNVSDERMVELKKEISKEIGIRDVFVKIK